MKFSGFGHSGKSSITLSATLVVGVLLTLTYSALAQRGDIRSGLRAIASDPAANSPRGRNFDLEQFRNGGSGDVRTAATGWSSSGSDATNAQWAEGEFVPYRLRFKDLTPGASYTVLIGYDAFANGMHAIDYLGTYNASAKDLNACEGAASCSDKASTFPIPQDTLTVTNQINPISRRYVSQASGVFTMWGGEISSTSYANFTRGDRRQVAVTFVADSANPVLAWAGHIASASAWGSDGSASNAKGTTFRMGVTGMGAGQELTLSPDAIQNIATIFVEKQVFSNDGTGMSPAAFPFTVSSQGAVVAGFSLVDNHAGDPPSDPHQVDVNVGFQGSVPVTIEEGATPGWLFFSVVCENASNPLFQYTVTGSQVTFLLVKGESVNCTFSNSQLTVTAAPASVAGRVATQGGSPIRGALLTLTNLRTGESKTVITNNFGYYSFTDASTEEVYSLTATSKRYKFANASRTITLLDNLSGVDFVSR